MTGSNAGGGRRTRLFGTHGELDGGGDWGLMDAFVQAVATGDPSLIRSVPRESLAAHLAMFGAERARQEGVVAVVGA